MRRIQHIGENNKGKDEQSVSGSMERKAVQSKENQLLT
jgi:hypothetical protein